jgi:hypothetical protein
MSALSGPYEISASSVANRRKPYIAVSRRRSVKCHNRPAVIIDEGVRCGDLNKFGINSGDQNQLVSADPRFFSTTVQD